MVPQKKMIPVKRLLAILFLAVLAAGCSNQTESTGEVKPEAKNEVTAAAPAPAPPVEVAKTVAPGVNLQPGLWEITTVMESPNMPMAMPPTTAQQCLSEEDYVPKSNASASSCEIANLKVDGNTVSYDLTCSSEGNETVSSGRITYAGTTMEGTFEMKVSGQANMQMTSRLSGRRIGPCQ